MGVCKCLSCHKDVYSDESSKVWKCPYCKAYILAEGSRIGDIYILIENLNLQKSTKEDMQYWAIKMCQDNERVDVYRNVLWGMAKVLLREGLIDRDAFIKIARFTNVYQGSNFIEVIDELNKLWAKNSEVTFGEIISTVIGCLESDYYSATENDWIDAILKAKNNKLTNEYKGITYYIYPSVNGYIGSQDKLKIYTDYKSKYEDVIKEMENKILECGENTYA